ncbi:MAG: ABC transporter permease [Chloroflexi bacterium]|nr:ABC transporter permease [Chloroflexota bacterium]MDA8189754.1 ABC transporter permease [Dehalococcoidales bacterium]
MLTRLTELFKYRELVRNLVIRDLKVRYKSSFLGFVWSLLNPLLMMLVFTVVFTVMMPNKSIEKFPVFLLTAILPWNWCAASINGGIGSIVGNANLIKKVYFPREILPASVVLSNMVNYLLALIVLFAMLLAFGVEIQPMFAFLPILIFIQMIFLLGLAFFVSALNVSFRDTEVITEVGIMAWFFLTPVFYDIHDLFPQYERLMYILNPMASFISTYRLVLLQGAGPEPYFLLRTLATSLIVFALGYAFFIRQSRLFGEEL